MNTVQNPQTTRRSRRRSPGEAARTTTAGTLLGGALAATLLLAGCGQAETSPDGEASGSTPAEGTQASGPTATAAATEEPTGEATGEVVTVTDPWVESSDDPTAYVFAVLENASGQDVTLTGVGADVTGVTELHETVDGGSGSPAMRTVDGFTIPRGDSLELAPGGNHIALKELPDELIPGDLVELELRFEDGRTQALTVVAKEFAGTQGGYGETGGAGHGGH